jgi:hypothetical protein
LALPTRDVNATQFVSSTGGVVAPNKDTVMSVPLRSGNYVVTTNFTAMVKPKQGVSCRLHLRDSNGAGALGYLTVLPGVEITALKVPKINRKTVQGPN